MRALLLVFSLFMAMGLSVSAADDVNPTEIMKKINEAYAERVRAGETKYVEIDAMHITRRRGYADVTTTNQVLIHQAGPSARVEVLPGSTSAPAFGEVSAFTTPSHLRHVFVYNESRKELRSLFETHPLNHPNRETQVKAMVLNTERLPEQYQSLMMADEIPEEMFTVKWAGREEIAMGEEVYALHSLDYIQMQPGTDMQVRIWVNKTEMRIVRIETHTRQALAMDDAKEHVYITSLYSIRAFPGAQVNKALFNLELPENAEVQNATDLAVKSLERKYSKSGR